MGPLKELCGLGNLFDLSLPHFIAQYPLYAMSHRRLFLKSNSKKPLSLWNYYIPSCLTIKTT